MPEISIAVSVEDNTGQGLRGIKDAFSSLFSAVTEAAAGVGSTVADTSGTLSGLGKSAEFADVEVTKLFNTFEVTGPRIQEIGYAIARAYDEQKAQAQSMGAKTTGALADIADAMSQVEQAIKATESTIVDLDTELEKQRTLTIDTSGALSGLALVRDYLVEIINLKDQAGSSSTSGASSLEFTWDKAPVNSNAAGVSSVPATGLSRLSRREAATPATGNRAATSSLRPITISFGNIVINGVDKDARKLAREIAPAVRDEIRRIEARK